MSVPHVAVTGAAGYIGSRLVTQLRREHPDWAVTALDNFYRGQLRSLGDVPVEHVDVRNRDRLEAALSGADVVAHLAAVSGVDDCEDNPDLAYEVNVRAAIDVAWHCRQTGAGLIFPFSMAVLGDPATFPITVDHPREPMNWYGRTKLLAERAIDGLAAGAFPADQLMISNLYGHHTVDGRTVSKGTVINFFVDRALADEPITVYRPGSQSRNFVHVADVADAFVRSTERLLAARREGRTGARSYAVATDEDPSVMEIAELVRSVSREHGHDPRVELVENPRGDDETLVESFAVTTERTRADLGWEPDRDVESTVRALLAAEADD